MRTTIGRTARAIATRIAITLCDRSKHGGLRAIEKLLGARIQVYEPRNAIR